MTQKPVKSILHVEDDYSIQMSVKFALEDEGYLVNTASNGREALDFLLTHPNQTDLIFLDVMMPVMDGFIFCSEKSKDNTISNIPTIIYSADPRNKLNAEAIGLVFISKPFDLDYLLDEIAKYV
jgi:CheY-like chemotaxis protein